ncbi:hypothetical protein B0H13DRAFT_2385792 [Mycena leptocephala]|nr:hypothetical protein B0H13DRAFT_2385792 [Mycena leptocephala]
MRSFMKSPLTLVLGTTYVVSTDRERAQFTSIWGNDDDHMDEQFRPNFSLLPSTTAMDSQSAALSGASSEALDTTTPRAANPLAPPFPGVVILLFLAFCTTLLAGAWVL